MKRLKEFSHDGLSTLPKKINQKLVNENRIKLFQKLRDSFKNVTREIELEECIKNRAFRLFYINLSLAPIILRNLATLLNFFSLSFLNSGIAVI